MLVADRMISEQLIEEILAQKSAPAHITKPEELNAEKHRQRAEAARYLRNHQTILELYAGEGNLSEKVYAPLNPRRMVLVDDDARALEKAKVRLARFGVKKEFYPMTNEQFIKRGYLRKYPDVSLVDFDAYGSPGRTVQLFFDNYRVRQPMIAALTDGFPTDMRPWKQVNWSDMYALKQARPPTLGEICTFHDAMMRNLGARRRFKSWRIGRAFGGKSGRAVYGAYLLRPLDSRSKSSRQVLFPELSVSRQTTV
jgi:hypothetical protein